MRRILYTLPAVMICIFYGMLALLAGGFAAFQLKAWLIVGAPVLSAVLLLGGRWWGSIPGMLLGGFLIGLSNYQVHTLQTAEGLNFDLIAGIFFFAYYMIMGIICLKDAQKQAAQ